MRIGIVSQSYYPRFGGVTEHVHNSAVELRRRGHDVTIITGHFRDRPPGGPAAGVERVGTNVLVPFNQAFVDLTIGFGLRRRMRRLLRVGAYDLLHIHNPNAPTLPLLAVEEARCATVGTFHSTGGRSFLQDTFRDWLGRSVARLGAWDGTVLEFSIEPPEAGEGLAVLVQAPDGRMLGAAMLLAPG